MDEIAYKTIKDIEKNNGSFLCFSSVWNYWDANIGSKNSNAGKAIDKIFSENPDINEVLIAIGAKGRSAHSKTQLLLFDISNMTTEDRLNCCCDFMYTFTRNERS